MLVDANIFLEIFLGQEKSEECIALLEKVQNGDLQATISAFTLDSIALIMERQSLIVELKAFIKSIPSYKGLKIYMPNVKNTPG